MIGSRFRARPSTKAVWAGMTAFGVWWKWSAPRCGNESASSPLLGRYCWIGVEKGVEDRALSGEILAFLLPAVAGRLLEKGGQSYQLYQQHWSKRAWLDHKTHEETVHCRDDPFRACRGLSRRPPRGGGARANARLRNQRLSRIRHLCGHGRRDAGDWRALYGRPHHRGGLRV